MTKQINKTTQSAEGHPNSLPVVAQSHAYAHKLEAVKQMTTDILSRIENLLHDDPAAIVGKRSGTLPREIEENQAYFLQKIRHVHGTLHELAELLRLTPEKPDSRELVITELMLLFVLIESYRPERILESGWKPSDEIQSAILGKIESIGLDIINMRERLK